LTESEWNTGYNDLRAAKTRVELAETNSKTSETNAKTSETNSKTSETNSKTSETNSAESEQTTLGYKNDAAEILASTQELVPVIEELTQSAASSEQTATTKAGEANQSAIDSNTAKNLSIDAKNESVAAKNLAVPAADTAVSNAGTSTTQAGIATTQAGIATNQAAAYYLYNITLAVPLSAGAYYTLATAIAAVPVGVKKLGLELAFADTATTWLTYKFIGSSTATWSTVGNWQRIISERELIPNEFAISEAMNVLTKRIEDLETFIKNAVFENLQIDTITTVKDIKHKGASLILSGEVAPAITPDFVGQSYINTVGGATYQAKGTTNAADWKQTSN
jgi:hypothetical protein